ncbi:MAG: crosslink repair DNA glycosylase YcaQ family protein, partial [Pseudomonadota bacterium]|nr:crosslink repair DNA glycosylase YcaQ family protein [Pseudomonadota bacterium]
QKVYDLAERVIPEAARAVDVAPDDYVEWACGAALDRLGMATAGEIANFWAAVNSAEAKAWCQSKLGGEQGGDVIPVVVESADGSAPRRSFARADIAERLDSLPVAPRRLRVINPFDPLMRDRKRLLRLFNFDYRIEIFVPAAKRKYGYYVFALLDGERLVGRIDMKADRANDALAVAALWMEPGCRLTPARQRRLEAELDRQRRFSGLKSVSFADGYLRCDG